MNSKMNTNKVIRSICYNAIVCALYVMLVFIFSFMSYEALQLRIAEILIFLVLINKKYQIGLTLGCFIANIIGPLGLIDAIVGGTSTLIACNLIHLCKKPWLMLIFLPLSNILVGLEIAFIYALDFIPALISILWIMLSELIMASLALVIYYIFRKKNFMKFLGDI